MRGSGGVIPGQTGRSSPPFLWQALAHLSILPRHLFVGKDLRRAPALRAPIGTGPFRFVEWKSGERIVLAVGMGACGLLLVVAGQAETFWQLYVLLFLAGAAGASVNAATGRAARLYPGTGRRA